MTISHALRRALGSNPVVGSSRKSSSGSPASAIATSSRRCWPPLSRRTRSSRLLGEPDDLDDLVGRTRVRVVAAVHLDRLAHGEERVDAGRLQHDPDPLLERMLALRGVVPEDLRRSRPFAVGTPRGSRWSWSCRRRSGRGARTPRRGRREDRCRRPPRRRRRTCAGPRSRSRARPRIEPTRPRNRPRRRPGCAAARPRRTGGGCRRTPRPPSPPSRRRSPETCGRDDHLGHRPQGRIVGQRLLHEDVERRPGDRAVAQRVDQRRLVDRAAPAHVDEARGRPHRGEGLRVEDRGRRRGQRQRVEHVVGATERLVEAIGSGAPSRGRRRSRAARPTASTVIPRARARTAVARPIGPGPTTTRCDRRPRSRRRPSVQRPRRLIDDRRLQARRERDASRRSPTRRSVRRTHPRAFVTTTSLDASSGNSSPSTPSLADWIHRSLGGRRRTRPEPRPRRTPRRRRRPPRRSRRRPRRRPPRTAAPRASRPARSPAAARPRSRRGPRRPACAQPSQRLPPAEPAVHAVVVGDVVLAQPPAQEHLLAVALGREVDEPGRRDRAAGCRARRGTRPRSFSVSWCRNQSDPATPPPSAATASVIRSLEAIRPSRASRSRGSRSRSSASSRVRLVHGEDPIRGHATARTRPGSSRRSAIRMPSRLGEPFAPIDQHRRHPERRRGHDVELGVVADVHRVGRVERRAAPARARRSAGRASRRPRAR